MVFETTIHYFRMVNPIPNLNHVEHVLGNSQTLFEFLSNSYKSFTIWGACEGEF